MNIRVYHLPLVKMEADETIETPPINMQYMPHHAFMCGQGEDWAGITNPQVRRKLQNRLNQRARRKRKAKCSVETETRILSRRDAETELDQSVELMDLTQVDAEQRRAALHRFACRAMASYKTTQPRADHLLRLIQLNIITSLTRNSEIIGLEVDWLVCKSVSPFGMPSTTDPESSSPPSTILACPQNLLPTSLQLRIPHHPWVDLLPLPRIRDNLLTAIAQILSHDEENQLWTDLFESGGEKNWTGMIVWGEPWNHRNWEVTLPFLQRWGWLLEGCHELRESTNYWRRKRGDRPISIAAWSPKGQSLSMTHVRREACHCEYHQELSDLAYKALQKRQAST